ncbi:hypothetical protein [Burkholderia ambifaria]|uniref:hypothetical protein n=1 Tax=Burkholderia ambifaria TaxID=152480 RepID=UPI00158F2BA2|nr:hypothetical protein [Burkholderia ambifaria]
MSSLRETDAVLKTAVNYSDRYTRIVVVAHRGCADLRASQRCSQPPQQQIGQDTGATPTTYASMGYEKTPFLVRYFSQPRRSIALSANLSAGAFVATVPIMTITHSGDSNGDAWARTEYSQVQQMPWFLVRSDGSNSVLSTRFTLSATESIQFQGAVIGLNAAVSLARVLAPQGALVTTLTESGEKARAQALDNTLSSLFAMNIAEQHWSDADIRRWRRGYGLEIHVSIPPESGNLTDQVQPVGNWIVTLDNPRQSIFSDIRSCVSENDQDCDAEADAAITKQILKTVKAADVLSFNLIPLTSPNTTLGTVGTYISQHDGFSTGLASMSAAGAKGATDAKQLCRNIRSWTSSAGFSSLDQDIILWAIATGMPSVPAPTGKMLLTACNDDNLKNLPAPT